MILELAEIDILPGKETAFEEVVRTASAFFLATPGCLGFKATRSIEHPHRFRLLVRWESVEHHMEGFRHSDAFIQWRLLAAPCFAKPPRVEHMSFVIGE
jgi:quinol monooxygenase YgiN